MPISVDFSAWQNLNKDEWLTTVIAVIAAIIIIFATGIILGLILFEWLKARRKRFVKSTKFICLCLHIPPENLKSPKAVENIFSQIASIPQNFTLIDKWIKGKYPLQTSFEIAAFDGLIHFIIYIPKDFKDLAESVVFAQYPDAEIEEIADYAKRFNQEYCQDKKSKECLKLFFNHFDLWGTEFKLSSEEFYPIRTYPLFEHQQNKEFADPLSSVLQMMSHLKPKEEFWFQITMSPVQSRWKEQGAKAIQKIVEQGRNLAEVNIKSSSQGDILTKALTPINNILVSFLDVIFQPASNIEKQPTISAVAATGMIPPEMELIIKAVREKISRVGLACKIRACYIAPNSIFDKTRIIGDFQGIMEQFTNPQMNSLISDLDDVTEAGILLNQARLLLRKKKLLKKMQHRSIKPHKPGYVLNVEELATLWHFPSIDISEKGTRIKQIHSKRVFAKQRLPQLQLEAPDEIETLSPGSQGSTEYQTAEENITILGETNFRNQKEKFGIKQEDRRRHVYITGKTGMGKSTLMQNMIYSDISKGKGLALIDPHGDLAENVLNIIPTSRVNDVIYFNPADQNYPIAFNILEAEEFEHRFLVSSALVGIFKKIWADSWGPRLEYLLRNSLLALLETQGNTLLGVTRLFIDKPYRKRIINQVNDPVVKNFWNNEYTKYSQNFQVEAISPIQNKIGQFISIPLIRNIIGQVKSRIDFREIMDKKKILIVNLAKGLIGEDVSSLLGATIISKLQIAAMMRADMPEEQREDFYLYIDEFQNFSTESFAAILSEARKYRLNLTIAHQYLEQLEDPVKFAVFGNVGTTICFSIGAEDAEFMEKQFAPEFTAIDLINLGKYEIALKLMIDGVTSRPFSARTLSPLAHEEVGNRDKIVNVSRERYTVSREVIEEKLVKWLDTGPEQQPISRPSQNFKARPQFNNPKPQFNKFR